MALHGLSAIAEQLVVVFVYLWQKNWSLPMCLCLSCSMLDWLRN